MADKIPFDEDTMTLIMGLGGPEEPGQHGRLKTDAPSKNAIDIITQIRDLCEEFLLVADKEKEERPDEKEEKQDIEEDSEE